MESRISLVGEEAGGEGLGKKENGLVDTDNSVASAGGRGCKGDTMKIDSQKEAPPGNPWNAHCRPLSQERTRRDWKEQLLREPHSSPRPGGRLSSGRGIQRPPGAHLATLFLLRWSANQQLKNGFHGKHSTPGTQNH